MSLSDVKVLFDCCCWFVLWHWWSWRLLSASCWFMRVIAVSDVLLYESLSCVAALVLSTPFFCGEHSCETGNRSLICCLRVLGSWQWLQRPDVCFTTQISPTSREMVSTVVVDSYFPKLLAMSKSAHNWIGADKDNPVYKRNWDIGLRATESAAIFLDLVYAKPVDKVWCYIKFKVFSNGNKKPSCR